MSPKRCRRAVVLPDHLIEEIFLRLPAKSLLRCRQLSRAWAATLSSHDFEELYLRVANSSGGPCRVFGVQEIWRLHAQEPRNVLPPLTSAPRVIELAKFPLLAPWSPPPTEEEEDEGNPPGHVQAWVATAQCRGLVVLRAVAAGPASSPVMSYVCNPSTGQMASLPEGRTTGFQGSVDSRERYDCLGLGYDVRTRKHKVVRICYSGPRSAACEVYVVNGPTGSWRPVELAEKLMGWNWIDPGANSVFAQGHVYWLAYRELCPPRQGTMFVVSFSLGDDKLGIIRVEPPLPLRVHPCLDLVELGGRLCLFDPYFTHFDGPRYDIWELNNQHGSGLATWDLHYRIDLGRAKVPLEVMRCGASPLAIIDNGRRMVLAQSDAPDQVYSYDSVTNHVEELLDWSGQSVPNPTLGLTHVAVYQESIASPGRQPCKDTVLISSPSTQALSLVLQSGRLPEEQTVGRLMCVCRSWRSMVSSLYCQHVPRY